MKANFEEISDLSNAVEVVASQVTSIIEHVRKTSSAENIQFDLRMAVKQSEIVQQFISELRQHKVFCEYENVFGSTFQSNLDDYIPNAFLTSTAAHTREESTKLVCDANSVMRKLVEIATIIISEEMEVETHMRIMNVDLEEKIEFGNLCIYKTTTEHIKKTYPWEQQEHGIPSHVVNPKFRNTYDENHLVVACVRTGLKGTEIRKFSESNAMFSVEQSNSHLQRVVQAFMLTGEYFDSPKPTVPKYIIRSFMFNAHCPEPFTTFIAYTPSLFPVTKYQEFMAFYNLLDDAVDKVLSRSLDRFLAGINKDSRHPLSLNVPNYDKIVDYCIALEAILQTVEDRPNKQELSYRFQMNGSAILFAIGKLSKSQGMVVLSNVYKIRSALVHGDTNEGVHKKIKKLAQAAKVQIDEENCITSAFEVFKWLEQVLREIYIWLYEQEYSERPYRKKNGWEELIWAVPNLTKPT